MTKAGEGAGAAFDATAGIDTTPDPPDEAKIAQGIADSKAVYLAEARDAVDRAHIKLDRARAEVLHAEQIAADAQSTLEGLEA